MNFYQVFHKVQELKPITDDDMKRYAVADDDEWLKQYSDIYDLDDWGKGAYKKFSRPSLGNQLSDEELKYYTTVHDLDA